MSAGFSVNQCLSAVIDRRYSYEALENGSGRIPAALFRCDAVQRYHGAPPESILRREPRPGAGRRAVPRARSRLQFVADAGGQPLALAARQASPSCIRRSPVLGATLKADIECCPPIPSASRSE